MSVADFGFFCVVALFSAVLHSCGKNAFRGYMATSGGNGDLRHDGMSKRTFCRICFDVDGGEHLFNVADVFFDSIQQG